MNVHSKNISPKREAVLDAALRLVSQHGFHGTSMSMLAAEADCGAGTIYNYFKSKDELLEALFRKLKLEFYENLLDGDAAQEPMEQRFMRMWRNMMRYYLNHPESVAYFQQYHSSPYFSSESARFAENMLAPLVQIFEQAMQDGRIRTLPLPVLESLTIDLAMTLVRRHSNGEIILDHALIEETGTACWQSLKGTTQENRSKTK